MISAMQLMDGAMGTELQRAGLRVGECGEAWNLTYPEQVRAIHQAYYQAGARCLLTNTFQSNPTVLARYGLAHELEGINRAAVALCRGAGGTDVFVLGSVGPFEPLDDAERIFRSLADADAILLETWSDPRVFKLAAADPRPVYVSIAYQHTPAGVVSRSGHRPEDFARLADEHEITALGVNCGRDMSLDDVIGVLRAYRMVSQRPVFARPNAGTPLKRDGAWVYPVTPQALAARLPDFLDACAVFLGGCCGTTPSHISALRSAPDKRTTRAKKT